MYRGIIFTGERDLKVTVHNHFVLFLKPKDYFKGSSKLF